MFPDTTLGNERPIIEQAFTILTLTLTPRVMVIVKIIGTLFTLLRPVILVQNIISRRVRGGLGPSLVDLIGGLFGRVGITMIEQSIFVIKGIMSMIYIQEQVCKQRPSTIGSRALCVIRLVGGTMRIACTITISILGQATPCLVRNIFLMPDVVRFGCASLGAGLVLKLCRVCVSGAVVCFLLAVAEWGMLVC